MDDDGRGAFPTAFTCLTEPTEHGIVVRPVGVFGLRAAVQVRTTMLKVLAEQPASIIVDLSGLTVADDSALSVFAALARQAAAWPGCPLVFYGATEVLAGTLLVRGLHRQATVTQTWPQAVLASRRPPIHLRLQRRFLPVPASVPAARQSIVAACRRWHVPVAVRSRIEVVVAELVTNAVRHAHTPIEFIARRTDQYVHMAVRDFCVKPPRLAGPATPSATSGRGLLIVDGFSASWGTTPTRDGKVVWATVRHRELGAAPSAGLPD